MFVQSQRFGNRIRFRIACATWLIFGWVACQTASAQDVQRDFNSLEFTDQQLEFFESRVRPILAERCYECHGPDVAAVEGGLNLASRAGILSGGDSGPAIDRDDPGNSLLIKAINYSDVFEMPPDSKMPAEEIEILTRWIEMNAPWPDSNPAAVTESQFDVQQLKAKHWCWQPIEQPEIPVVGDSKWPADPIDHFILAKLEASGLQPAAPADRRALIRRLSFDLTGLPPTPAEIADFLNDSSETAIETVVDRLLASSRFGEHWTRHWQDLVRYAETGGHEFDFPIPQAWLYRDYLIRAFNQDVPYDQIIREHIAGDLLPQPRRHPDKDFNESVLGTGFWFLGEDFQAPVDVRGDQVGHFDNQIDVMSKTFLGLTVACARCHDHKFDAISTEDYYALTGFLKSSRRDDVLLDPGRQIEAAYQSAVSFRADARTATDHFFKVIARAKKSSASSSPSAVSTNRVSTSTDSPAPSHQADNLKTDPDSVLFADFSNGIPPGWFRTGWAFEACIDPTLSAAGPLLMRSGSASSSIYGAQLTGILRSPTFTVEHDFIHYQIAGTKSTIRVIVEGHWIDRYNPLLFEGLSFNVDDTNQGQPDHFHLHVQSGDLKLQRGHRAYIELIDEGEGWLAIQEIRFSDTDQAVPREVTPLDQIIESTLASHDTDVTKSAGEEKVNVHEMDLRDAVAKLKQVRQKIADAASPAPPPLLAIGMTDGTPEDEWLLIRGNHKNPGAAIPRRFLSALDGSTNLLIDHSPDSLDPTESARPNVVGFDQSGRFRLANQIADADNPLTSRVIVNRLWHHLFGRGIVASVDNFGVLGEKPTHPELLDYLAREFTDNQWSLKQLIRRLVLTRTYQMTSIAASSTASAAQEIDPANHLLFRANVRRITAQSIRDSMLLVSGRLNEQMYGTPVAAYLTEFMQGRGRPETSGPLDGDGRRSIYLEVRRNFLSPLMLAFDSPIPLNTIGQRNQSNVPAQALMLMNDPLVVELARNWAAELISRGEPDRMRLQRMFEAALGRPATILQLDSAEQFLEQQANELKVDRAEINGNLDLWSDLCQVVFNMKQFIYLE